tara:strand:+ start:212 stop:406 length:195 start_codon:yes stop_codon:yes gene_type:complete
MIDPQLEDYHYSMSQEIREVTAERNYLTAKKIGWNCDCNWQNHDDRVKCWLCHTPKPKEIVDAE